MKRPTERNGLKIVTYIVLIVATFISLFPFYFMFVSATNTHSDILSASPRLIFGSNLAENFKNLNERLDLVQILFNSCILTFTYTFLSMLIHSMSGYALAKFNFKGKGLCFGVIMVTMMIPGQVMYVPLFTLMNRIGWANTYQAVILPALGGAFGMFMMRQNMLSFPTSLIEAANEINAELDRYVEAGKAEFTAALEAAVAVYEDGDAMQAEVNEAADNLLNAMLNLRYKADKSILEEVLAEASKVDANAYTAESYAALQAAVAEASNVYNNENASQEEVNRAVANVQAAMDDLVAVEGGTTETSYTDNATQTGQESTTTKANAAKTGDFTPIAGIAMLVVAGITVLISRKK